MRKKKISYRIEDLKPSKTCMDWCKANGFTELDVLFKELTMTQLANKSDMTIVIFRELTTLAYVTGLSPKLIFD